MRSLITLLLSVIAGIVNAQGTLVTVAGTGVPGFSGDGGDAKLAQVSQLLRCTGSIDKNGNLYFTDEGNYRIRRVDRKTGVITTFAGNGGKGYTGDGGLATSAEINKPFGINFDWKGNLLFIDSVNCRIRSISPSGIINYWGGTVCGEEGDGGLVSAAKLQYTAIMTGDSGKLYASALAGIRLVNSLGVINRIAGSSFGYSGDGGLAIYAQFSGVSSMVLDQKGNLVLADGNAALRVRRIDEKGIVNTLVGNGSGTVSGDGGKAVGAGIGFPLGLAYDQFGNLFVCASNRIRRIDSKDSTITTIAGTGVAGYSGEGVDAKTHSISTSFIFFDTAHYELYFFDPSRLRKITNLIKPVTINEAAKTYTPEFFPNPANTKISLSGIPIRSEIWIYDLLGREHLHTTMSQMEVDVDVSGFAPGTYILRAKTPTGKEVHSKFLKQ
jgi:hypothetical protein